MPLFLTILVTFTLAFIIWRVIGPANGNSAIRIKRTRNVAPETFRRPAPKGPDDDPDFLYTLDQHKKPDPKPSGTEDDKNPDRPTE